MMASISIEDFMFHETRGKFELEARRSREQKESTGKASSNFDELNQNLGLNMLFGTIGQVLNVPGTSEQPFFYTSNLLRVIELAKREGREIDFMQGICLFYNDARICATNGSYFVGLQPKWKELDPTAPFTLDQLLDVHRKRRDGKEFPGGKPTDLGKPEDYFPVEPSYLRLEPSIGKILKIFNYIEFARVLGFSPRIVLPHREYKDVSEIWSRFNRESVEQDIDFLVSKLEHTIRMIGERFYPGLKMEVVNTMDPEYQEGTKAIVGQRSFRDAVYALGDKSCTMMGAETAKEFGAGFGKDLDWTALFLGKEGKVLLEKDSPSRIILVNARDIFSFAVQSLLVGKNLAELTGVNWQDRLVICGVSGGPALKMHTDEERRKYLVVAERLEDDDYMANAKITLLLGEDNLTIRRKIDEIPVSDSKQRDPIYAIVRKLHHYAYPQDILARSWLESYDLCRNRTDAKSRHEFGKNIIYNLVERLKLDLEL